MRAAGSDATCKCLDGDCNYVHLHSYESKLKVLKTRSRVLKRFKMTQEQLLKELKFSCVIMNCATHRILSFTQILNDILSTTDGSLNGPLKSPGEPQTVTVVTLNQDLFYSSSYPRARLGPKSEEIMFMAAIKASLGIDVEVERYGKP